MKFLISLIFIGVLTAGSGPTMAPPPWEGCPVDNFGCCAPAVLKMLPLRFWLRFLI